MSTISVVMTTYNGEKYILEQMDSIYNQTMKPEEVIIVDDCSKDDTCKIIEEYVLERKLNNWKLFRNEKNVGWKQNFVKALKLASGDIIFLADQDDIWFKDKIEIMSSTMLINPQIDLLVGNSVNFYSTDCKRKRIPFYSFKKKAFYLDNIWNGKGFIHMISTLLKDEKKNTNSLVKIKFDEGLFLKQRQGCVMAARKSLIEEALPYWTEDCPHDTLLWFFSAAKDSLYLMERYVINYRHHQNNTGFIDTLGEGLTAQSEISKIKKMISQISSLSIVLKECDVSEAIEKANVLNRIEAYNVLRIEFLCSKKVKKGIAVIKKGKGVGKREVLFDWLLAYLT